MSQRHWKQPLFTENVPTPFSEPCAWYYDSPMEGRYYRIGFAPLERVLPRSDKYHVTVERISASGELSHKAIEQAFTAGHPTHELLKAYDCRAACANLITMRHFVLDQCAMDRAQADIPIEPRSLPQSA